jgi:hypothetical protein
MTFWYGSGSGYVDPCLLIMGPDPDLDPDPTILVIDLQDANKKLIFFQSFSAFYFLKVYLHHFSKINCQKKSQNSRNQGFAYFFCFMIEGIGSGSVPLTNGSGFGSRRPKSICIRRIRIHNIVLNFTLGFREGGDVAAKKGARILWALDGRFLIVSGFSRQSERQITIYETRDLRQ